MQTAYTKIRNNKKADQMIEARECGIFSPKLMETFEQVREEFEAWKP